MGAARKALLRLAALGLVAFAVLFAAAAGSATTTDASILNQTVFTDPTGDAVGGGLDLSGLTVTSYNDGTISFQVSFANRTYLTPNDTVQIFVDLNDDGTADLNFSIWPSFQPSYLSRWTGTAWTNVRQLPELAQSPGGFTVRESLSELQGDGAVPVAGTIQIAVGAWTGDINTALPASAASDWIPSATSWADFSINKPAVTPTTTTATTPATTTTTPRSTTGSTRSGSSTTGKLKSPAVKIMPLAPLSATLGKDVTLKIVLESATGPIRLFKVCTTLPPTPGVVNLTQCRSDDWAGGSGNATFKVTYKMGRVGTTHISVAASAGTAKATATAVVHVTKA